MTAMQAKAVPVLPRPPQQPISTRSDSARRQASLKASAASGPSVGSQKSGQRTHLNSHSTEGGRLPSKYTANSGCCPAGTGSRRARPRMSRPEGRPRTPTPADSHVSFMIEIVVVAPAIRRRQPEIVSRLWNRPERGAYSPDPISLSLSKPSVQPLRCKASLSSVENRPCVRDNCVTSPRLSRERVTTVSCRWGWVPPNERCRRDGSAGGSQGTLRRGETDRRRAASWRSDSGLRQRG